MPAQQVALCRHWAAGVGGHPRRDGRMADGVAGAVAVMAGTEAEAELEGPPLQIARNCILRTQKGLDQDTRC